MPTLCPFFEQGPPYECSGLLGVYDPEGCSGGALNNVGCYLVLPGDVTPQVEGKVDKTNDACFGGGCVKAHQCRGFPGGHWVYSGSETRMHCLNNVKGDQLRGGLCVQVDLDWQAALRESCDRKRWRRVVGE